MVEPIEGSRRAVPANPKWLALGETAAVAAVLQVSGKSPLLWTEQPVALCYSSDVSTTISQRELRNNSAVIMRRLRDGESFTLTSNGVVVGSLTPTAQPTSLLITRPATTRGLDGFPLRAPRDTSLSAILDELREDRL